VNFTYTVKTWISEISKLWWIVKELVLLYWSRPVSKSFLARCTLSHTQPCDHCLQSMFRDPLRLLDHKDWGHFRLSKYMVRYTNYYGKIYSLNRIVNSFTKFIFICTGGVKLNHLVQRSQINLSSHSLNKYICTIVTCRDVAMQRLRDGRIYQGRFWATAW
jgi:hypothetical protein